MPTIVSFTANRAVDINGFAVPGALATFHASGTSAPREVYSDPECTIPHPSPLVADGAGVFPPIYAAGGGDLKATVTTPAGAVLAGYPMDPVKIVDTAATGAAGISFDPTDDIPATNVQDAIEQVQANMIEPLADYGLGVTGNSTLLIDIDELDIASGFYRYDGTTAGTFPSGITQENGGVVLVFRQTGTAAQMMLIPAGNERVFHRRLFESWQSWVWLIDSNDTVTDAIWEAGASAVPAIPTPAAIKAAKNADPRTWQNMTGSRTQGVNYGNATGQTIQVAVTITGNATASAHCGATAGTQATLYDSTAWNGWAFVFDVPPGQIYRVVSTVAPVRWMELR